VWWCSNVVQLSSPRREVYGLFDCGACGRPVRQVCCTARNTTPSSAKPFVSVSTSVLIVLQVMPCIDDSTSSTMPGAPSTHVPVVDSMPIHRSIWAHCKRVRRGQYYLSPPVPWLLRFIQGARFCTQCGLPATPSSLVDQEEGSEFTVGTDTDDDFIVPGPMRFVPMLIPGDGQSESDDTDASDDGLPAGEDDDIGAEIARATYPNSTNSTRDRPPPRHSSFVTEGAPPAAVLAAPPSTRAPAVALKVLFLLF
jgi:hypothetical protein